jgi:adenosine deaminase
MRASRPLPQCLDKKRMPMKLTSLMLSLALASGANAFAAPSANEAATARHFAALTAGGEPKLAELTMFFSQMPKGAELHHHFDGAIYAEKFIEWIDRQNFCIHKSGFRIETDRAIIETQRALPLASRECLSGAETVADNALYRDLLQHWSVKDFYNHGALQSPPDTAFFNTFLMFGPVAYRYLHEGLLHLKERAIAEHVGYIETIFTLPPFTQDSGFDSAMLRPDLGAAAQEALMRDYGARLAGDAALNNRIVDYVGEVESAAAGIDDANFTMRYQAFVLRMLAPSQVFSNMASAFKAASKSKMIVAVNIVGGENEKVAMRDYTMHMRMFKFFKAQYPGVKVALHAGELALGMVPPEGLKSHIEEALVVGGADRIGHGSDLAHEANAPAILAMMRAKDIPAEINLSSNDFILGLHGQDHPVTLYRKYGVPVVLSTDDAGVARRDLAGEYVLFASRYRPSYAEVKKISYNGVKYAFLPAADKQRLTGQLDARFARFESAIAAMDSARH